MRTTTQKVGTLAVAIALTMVGALLAGAAPAAAAPPARPARPAEDGKPSSKLSPRLAKLADPSVEAMTPRAKSEALSIPDQGSGSIITRPDGRVLVNLRLTDKDPATLAAIGATGGHRVAVSDTDPLATFEMRPEDLPALEGVPGVQFAQEVLAPEINGSGLPAAATGPVSNAICATGNTVSEADVQLNVATARAAFGVDGTGVQVGLLSDSFNQLGGLAADQAGGELPGPTNPCGHTSPITIVAEMAAAGGADEGRAMAQAVHDLAPGASISYATAFNGEADFANQIRALRTNGAKVIADDVTYYDEPMYQDGVVSKAVNEVTAAGVTYFSSAANSNVIVGGKEISSYEATAGYRPTACPAGVAIGTLDCHDFDPGVGVSNGDTLTVNNGGKVKFSLGWNEPQLGVTTNLDAYLIDQSTGSVVASSTTNNLSSQNTFEFVSFTNASGVAKNYKVVIGRLAGSATPRFKFILHRPSGFTAVQWNTSSGGDIIGPTIFGHNANLVAGSIAAVPYYDSATVETYSSRGPTTYCFGPVGFVAAAPLPSCQTKNLDVAATDGAQNSFFGGIQGDGLHHFFGTSQSAPHAAAIAILETQARPCRTPAEKLAAQRASGRAIAGFAQNALGSGLVDANAAIAALASCGPVPTAPAFPAAAPGNASATVSWWPANGNGFPITASVITPFIAGVAQTPQVFANNTNVQVVTGLTNGTTYTFKIAATNANGTGPTSGATAPTKVGVPAAPGSLTVTSGNTTMTVGWTVNANGSPITGSVITPYIAGVAQTPRTFNTGASSQVVNGLVNGTAYTFKVTVTNAIGTGPSSAASAALPSGLPAVIAFPGATAGHGAATVNWWPANGNGSPITGSVITPYIAGVAQTPVTFNDNLSSHAVPGLTNGTAYTFKIAGINAIGTGPQSAATTAVTPTP